MNNRLTDPATVERMEHLIAKQRVKSRPFRIIFWLCALVMAVGMGMLVFVDSVNPPISYFFAIIGGVSFVLPIVAQIVLIIIYPIRALKMKRLRASIDMSAEGVVCISHRQSNGGIWVMVPHVDYLMEAIPYAPKSSTNRLYEKGAVVQVKWNSANTKKCFIVEQE